MLTHVLLPPTLASGGSVSVLIDANKQENTISLSGSDHELIDGDSSVPDIVAVHITTTGGKISF